MRRWLTDEEREELKPKQRRELRRARKLERWPDTDGKSPAQVKLEAVAVELLGVLAARLVEALVELLEEE